MNRQVLTDVELKAKFEEVFPEYAQRLNTAITNGNLEEVYNAIVQETQDAMIAACAGMNDDDSSGIPAIIIDEAYKAMIEAKDGDIKYYLTYFLNTLQLVKPYLDDKDLDMVAKYFVLGGVFTLTSFGISAYINALVRGLETIEACAAALVSTASGVASIITFVVVTALIPIIYFMEKPAVTLMMFINDLKHDIRMVEYHCKHGKLVSKIKEIKSGVKVNSRLAGVYMTSKRDDALVGSTVAYKFQVMENGKAAKDFYIGLECPLSSIYGGNCCFASFTGNVSSICDKVHDEQKKTHHISGDGYAIDIRCNSQSGSVAYYIGRIYEA